MYVYSTRPNCLSEGPCRKNGAPFSSHMVSSSCGVWTFNKTNVPCIKLANKRGEPWAFGPVSREAPEKQTNDTFSLLFLIINEFKQSRRRQIVF